ncbi:hypothetical protein AgCh_007245 [Apium graveolens]
MGFRCCKCCRIKSPIYPIEKPVSEGRNLLRGDLKQGNMGVEDQLAHIEGANPFSSLSKAEHVSDEKTPEVNTMGKPTLDGPRKNGSSSKVSEKVANFGLSKIKRNTSVSGGVRGTLPWMAPELLNGSSSKVSEKLLCRPFEIVVSYIDA